MTGRSSVFGTWVPITHYGVGADLPVGPSERASARRVGQEADPYKSGRTSRTELLHDGCEREKAGTHWRVNVAEPTSPGLCRSEAMGDESTRISG